jgi:CRISPR-associated endoribonuclease Cas6
MMKLYSSVIRLVSIYSTNLVYPGGQHAHAAFMDLVRGVDPDLSARLHDTNARKPFTVSPLMGLPKPSYRSENGGMTLPEGWECWLRVTILDDALFRAFIDHFLNGRACPEVRIGDARFMVSEVLTTPDSHPWAGYTPLAELQKRLDQPPPARWKFELVTPTQFGWKDKMVQTMPLPKLVFGSLAGAWREMSDEDSVEAIEKFAEENVLFGEYDLRTERLIVKNSPHLGGVGRVGYLYTGPADHPLARSLNFLAGLAFYTGLGKKTTMGMGMVRAG